MRRSIRTVAVVMALMFVGAMGSTAKAQSFGYPAPYGSYPPPAAYYSQPAPYGIGIFTPGLSLQFGSGGYGGYYGRSGGCGPWYGGYGHHGYGYRGFGHGGYHHRW